MLESKKKTNLKSGDLVKQIPFLFMFFKFWYFIYLYIMMEIMHWVQ